MSINNRLIGIVVVGLSLNIQGTQANAGSIEAPYPDPNPIDITCMDDEGNEVELGQLEIGVYESSGVYTDSAGVRRAGIGMEATFSGMMDPDCTVYYDFVQAIVGGTSTIGNPPYLDPFNRDDDLPFYWTESERDDNYAIDNLTGDFSLKISDYPSQPLSVLDDTDPASVQFETALVCVDWSTNTINFLQSFTWGYAISTNGPDMYDIDLDQMQWINPSNTIMGLVDAWSTRVDGETWNVAEGECCECVVPTPSAFALVAFGFVTILTRKRIRIAWSRNV